MRILRFDPSNEEASMLMAELMMELAATGGRSEGGMQECASLEFGWMVGCCVAFFFALLPFADLVHQHTREVSPPRIEQTQRRDASMVTLGRRK